MDEYPFAKEVLGVMEAEGSVLDGHFVDDRNRHLRKFYNTSVVARKASVRRRFAERMHGMFIRTGLVDMRTIVAMPTAREFAQALADRHFEQLRGSPIDNVYGELDDGQYLFPHGFAKVLRGKKVLIVAPVFNDLSSLILMRDACLRQGAEVLGMAAVLNLADVRPEQLGVRHVMALAAVEERWYSESECPMCDEKIEVDQNYLRGKEFVRRRAAGEHFA